MGICEVGVVVVQIGFEVQCQVFGVLVVVVVFEDVEVFYLFQDKGSGFVVIEGCVVVVVVYVEVSFVYCCVWDGQGYWVVGCVDGGVLYGCVFGVS